MFSRDVIHPFSKGVQYRFTYVHLDGTKPFNYVYIHKDPISMDLPNLCTFVSYHFGYELFGFIRMPLVEL